MANKTKTEDVKLKSVPEDTKKEPTETSEQPIDTSNVPVPDFMVKVVGSKYIVPSYRAENGQLKSLVSIDFLSKGKVPNEEEITKLSLELNICRDDHQTNSTQILTWDGTSFDKLGRKLWNDGEGKEYDEDSKDLLKLTAEYNKEKDFYFVPGSDVMNPSFQFTREQLGVADDDSLYIPSVHKVVDVKGNDGVTHKAVLSALLYDIQFKNNTAKSMSVAQAVLKLQEAIMWLSL